MGVPSVKDKLAFVEAAAGPVTLVLKPSRRKWAAVLAICLLFTVIAGLQLAHPDSTTDIVVGALSLLLFGGGGLLVLVQLLLGRSELKLDGGGFTIVTLRRAEHFAWADVIEPFGVAAVSRRQLVVFSLNRPATKWGRLNAALTGQTHALPDTYGMDAVDLAILMTTCWQRAGGTPR